jgi:4-hydroxy-tetrahydrodipicolinate synthase
METLSGVFSALWTPTSASGEILWPALERNLTWQLEAGIDGVMALGSTAEFVHLSFSERKSILEFVSSRCAPRGKRVIANVSDTLLRNVVHLAQHARGAGAAAIAVLPPWYYAIEQRDLVEFFTSAQRQAGLPLVIYNYPEMTGKKVEIDTIRAVAKNVPVIAVKQSGADFPYHEKLIQAGRDLGFSVLTGADTRFEEALRLGSAGTISGLANCAADILVRIYRNFRAGNASPEETRLMTELASAIATLPFPPNVKAAIAARGFETGEPKNPLSPETLKRYDETVAKLRKFFAQIHPAGQTA